MSDEKLELTKEDEATDLNTDENKLEMAKVEADDNVEKENVQKTEEKCKAEEKLKSEPKPETEEKPKTDMKTETESPKTEVKSKTEVKPKSEANLKSEEKPKIEVKTKSEEKPKSEENPKTEVKTKTEVKPKIEEKSKGTSDVELEINEDNYNDIKIKIEVEDVYNELTLEDDDVDQLLNDEIKIIDDSEVKIDITDDNTETKNEVKQEKNGEGENNDSEKQPIIGRSLWVSGLSHSTRAADLKKHFLGQGRVIGAKVVSNSRDPGARCYGYIIMSTPEEADLCVKNLHHSKLLTRFISVQKSKSEKHGEETKSSSTPSLDADAKSKKPNDKPSVRKSKSDNRESVDKARSEKNSSKPRSESGRRHTSRDDKRRRDSSEIRKANSKSKSELDREVQRRVERARENRIRQEKWERERALDEQRRLREGQRRLREEATRLDHERYKLRQETERLQREKLELLRLEKEQLEKEREEIRKQKRKIEEATRKKMIERARQAEFKRRRERSPPRRSPVPNKIPRKHEVDKYKEAHRHPNPDKRKDDKYKEASKDYRSNYKGNEYGRGMDQPKFDRYQADKKASGIKPDDFSLKSGMPFEPPPPRISTNDANHFNNPSPMGQVAEHMRFSSTNRFRNDYNGKDIVPNLHSRNVDRSEHFPVDRHDRIPSDSMDHRPRPGYPMDYSKNDSRMGGVSSRDRMDSGRMVRDGHQMDMRGNRYREDDRDMRPRGWVGSGERSGSASKRVAPAPPPMSSSHRPMDMNWVQRKIGGIKPHSWDLNPPDRY